MVYLISKRLNKLPPQFYPNTRQKKLKQNLKDFFIDKNGTKKKE